MMQKRYLHSVFLTQQLPLLCGRCKCFGLVVTLDGPVCVAHVVRSQMLQDLTPFRMVMVGTVLWLRLFP